MYPEDGIWRVVSVTFINAYVVVSELVGREK
jgi:hypothetical protein